ncbi:hypothetical protein ACFVH4_18885 [Nocardia ignorata]|uniref:hypothetical protein n=1 Tax=Nocardia ignorata TaxID=145285 RepID=UPI00362AF01D
MTWFRIDDGFWSHPKVVGLSDSAVALWVRAGAYACQHLTDGAIAAPVLRMVGEKEAAAELVAAGLWKETAGGYLFHDWAEYQETSETVKERRAAARERQRKSRAARESKKAAPQQDSPEPPEDVTPDVTRDNTCEFSTPDPTRPDQEVTTDVVTSESAPRERAASLAKGHRLPEDWQPSGAAVVQMRAEFPGIDFWQENAKFRDYWSAQPGAKGRKTDWDATWRNWIRRAFEQSHRPGPQRAASQPTTARSDQKVNDTLEAGARLLARNSGADSARGLSA